jgi:glycyl-tRNA synthetase (class II)
MTRWPCPIPPPPKSRWKTLVALCKRRGFIFPSSEIYGGINGFFDYGPLGAELKKNIRDCWWDDMVRRRDDVVGIETSIIMHPKVWEASGHVAGFTDPLVDCKVSKQRYRADQLFFAPVVVDGKDRRLRERPRERAHRRPSSRRPPRPSSERRPSRAGSSPSSPAT